MSSIEPELVEFIVDSNVVDLTRGEKCDMVRVRFQFGPERFERSFACISMEARHFNNPAYVVRKTFIERGWHLV